MTQKANDQSQTITLRICSSKTGGIFQEIFPVHQTTFARVKYLATQFLFKKIQLDEIENYKLISIESKRTIDEQKTLREEKVKDGDEFILIRKLSNESTKIEQASETCPIDQKLITRRTQDLPLPINLPREPHLLTRRTEFRTDLSRILLTLIEISQKLLWYRSDAEQIFRQVERILSQSSNPSDEIEINSNHINYLIDIGFTEQQARFALKRTKSDLNAAMEFLLTEPKIDDENDKPTPALSYSHPNSFISFQEFRQKYFKPNPSTIQSLIDMGFDLEETINALRSCHNDYNLACDYLIGDKDQRQNLIDANGEQGLDPNSNLFKSLMENPTVQRAVNDPKIFFVILHLYENPDLITTYINEPDIGYLLLQISRIYNTERYQMDTSNSNQTDNVSDNED